MSSHLLNSVMLNDVRGTLVLFLVVWSASVGDVEEMSVLLQVIWSTAVGDDDS